MAWKQQLLTPNSFSRPERPIDVKGIVMHWVENAKTSAQFNWNWFELRKNGDHGYGSAHFVIDDIEVIQCIPIDEMGYHVGAESYKEKAIDRFGHYPNSSLIGIELCHPDWSGKFTDATLWNAVDVVAHLLNYFNLPHSSIVRHYDITGKSCPLYWVENFFEFDAFRMRCVERLLKIQDTEEDIAEILK